MGDLTVGALVFMIIVWAVVLGAAGISMKMLISQDQKKKK